MQRHLGAVSQMVSMKHSWMVMNLKNYIKKPAKKFSMFYS